MKVEINYPIYGDVLPAKHGYLLYSALCRWNPCIKDLDWQIKSINGFSDHKGNIHLSDKSSLRIRCDHNDLDLWYKLEKAELSVGVAHSIMIGKDSNTNILDGSPSLRSKIVTIKCKNREMNIPKQEFRDSLLYKLFQLGIRCEVEVKNYSQFYVKNNIVGGYAVHLSGLKKEESILIQSEGLGGRKHMGHGYFEPYDPETFASRSHLSKKAKVAKSTGAKVLHVVQRGGSIKSQSIQR